MIDIYTFTHFVLLCHIINAFLPLIGPRLIVIRSELLSGCSLSDLLDMIPIEGLCVNVCASAACILMGKTKQTEQVASWQCDSRLKKGTK